MSDPRPSMARFKPFGFCFLPQPCFSLAMGGERSRRADRATEEALERYMWEAEAGIPWKTWSCRCELPKPPGSRGGARFWQRWAPGGLGHTESGSAGFGGPDKALSSRWFLLAGMAPGDVLAFLIKIHCQGPLKLCPQDKDPAAFRSPFQPLTYPTSSAASASHPCGSAGCGSPPCLTRSPRTVPRARGRAVAGRKEPGGSVEGEGWIFSSIITSICPF